MFCCIPAFCVLISHPLLSFAVKRISEYLKIESMNCLYLPYDYDDDAAAADDDDDMPVAELILLEQLFENIFCLKVYKVTSAQK